jgi:hypothetical protein
MSTAIQGNAIGQATQTTSGLIDGDLVRAFARAAQAIAPTSGQVGYVLTALGSSTSNSAFNTYAPVTGLTLDLPVGTWIIIATGNCTIGAPAGAAGSIITDAQRILFDNVTTIASAAISARVGLATADTDSADGSFMLISTPQTVVSGTKNVKVEHTTTTFGGAPTGGTITTRGTSKMVALLIG